MALALDGSAENNSSGASSLTLTLTTSAANDVIIVCIAPNAGPVASVSSANVTYTKRSTNNLAGASFPEECWYGIASSPLSSEVITVTQQSSAFISAVAFGVSGANTSSPFDSHGPFTISAGPTDLSVTTGVANTFIFGSYRFGSTSTPTAGAGFTRIGSAVLTFHLTEYQIVSTTQSALDVAIGTGAGNQNGGVGDAIVQAGGGGGSAGTIGLQIGVSGAGNALIKSAGTVGLQIGVSGVGKSTAASKGTVSLQIGVSGHGAATAKSTGNIGLNLGLTGVAPHIAAAAGTIGLNLGIIGHGQRIGGRDVGLPLTPEQLRKRREDLKIRQARIDAEIEAKRADGERLRAGLREALHGPSPPVFDTPSLEISTTDGMDDEDEDIEFLLLSL